MKHLLFFTFCFLFISTTKTNAQEASINTDKLIYKIDEEIKLVFEVTKNFDSISAINLNDFRVLEGPERTIENSSINGVTEYKQKLTFKLIPKSSGNFTINSPIYYYENKKIIGKQLKIKIENSKLTDEEKKIIELKKMAESNSMPERTIRFVITEKIGYMEEFRNNKWEFKRALSKKEIEKMSRM